jgi:hypothetical protein
MLSSSVNTESRRRNVPKCPSVRMLNRRGVYPNGVHFVSCGSTAQFLALAASMKLSVSFRLLDLGQSAGHLGRVISSSHGICVSAPGECEDGEVGGMNGFGRGNLSTRRKRAMTPLCPP